MKSLPTLEKEAIAILEQEVIVTIGRDMLNKLHETFDSCKEKNSEADIVETIWLIETIFDSDWFINILDTYVRQNVDDVKETLGELLDRIIKTYKAEMIEWHTFLGFFSKRGRLRENEQVNIQLNKKVKQEDDDNSSANVDDDILNESFETKNRRLKDTNDKKMAHKSNLVPKTGKGKYNVTVPVPFEFLNKQKGFSIR